MSTQKEPTMKLVKTASGKQTIKMSRNEWEAIGKRAGWMKVAEDWNFIASLKEAKNSALSVLNRMRQEGGDANYACSKAIQTFQETVPSSIESYNWYDAFSNWLMQNQHNIQGLTEFFSSEVSDIGAFLESKGIDWQASRPSSWEIVDTSSGQVLNTTSYQPDDNDVRNFLAAYHPNIPFDGIEVRPN
jgi:hypothetical protein